MSAADDRPDIEEMSLTALREEYSDLATKGWDDPPLEDGEHTRLHNIWNELVNRLGVEQPECPECGARSWGQEPGDPKHCGECVFEPTGEHEDLIEEIDDAWQAILNGTYHEFEVMVTADVEHTPRVDADSADEAETIAREQIEEEYGVTADTVRHETELPSGQHQVCVWAERHLYETVVEATESVALEAGKRAVEREYAVQTSDIHGASARKLREIEPDDGGGA